MGDLGSIPGSGRFPREGNGNPLQYSCLESLMDGGAWSAAVYEVAKSRTRLSDFTFTFHYHALEKEMVTHSSVLAWRILGMGEPSGLPSMGSHRVRHDWSDLAAAAAAAAVAHKRYSIQMNYYPCCDSWGRKESDTTERLNWTELSMCSSSSTGLVLWGSQHIFGESQGSVPDNNVH